MFAIKYETFYHLFRFFFLFVSGMLFYGSIPVLISYIARIGLSLVANAPLNVGVDANTDAAVGIARAFSFISSDKDTRQAFDWLLQVSNAIGPFVLLNSWFCRFIRHPIL